MGNTKAALFPFFAFVVSPASPTFSTLTHIPPSHFARPNSLLRPSHRPHRTATFSLYLASSNLYQSIGASPYKKVKVNRYREEPQLYHAPATHYPPTNSNSVIPSCITIVCVSPSKDSNSLCLVLGRILSIVPHIISIHLTSI